MFLIIYLLIINSIGLLLMWTDKKKARGQKWRIPEKAFFICSLLGGAAGTWAGMYLFRHKTKHWYFVVFIPLILLIQILITVYIIYFA